ncbi:MAG TPA: STAS domain-containing protein [Chondromyces sp.]|nr:STAS domain-containing protein [Chondromyces sp.]
MKTKESINVGGISFGWDLDNGRFIYEGGDAVLFWIDTAMKEFFDTIEEVSGEEATSLVLEATGFRQGIVVGEYFQNARGMTFDEILDKITMIYGSAGWGLAHVLELDSDNYRVRIQFRDDWEYKINKAQGKEKGGTYLPAHYAGIFTGFFGKSMWYKVVQYQIEGHEETVVEYFPSDITVSKNIHELARKKEAEEIQRLQTLVDEKTKELQALVKDLSSPIIPVLEGIVVVPLLGRYEEDRAEELIEKTLNNLPAHRAEYLVLDLTGLENGINEYTASVIEKLGSAASLIGTKTILVGLSPELSVMITTQTNIDLSNFDCFQTLQHGIYYALAQTGRQIIG